MGLSTGSGIIVAQYFGAGKDEELKISVSTSFIMLAAIGLVLSLVGGMISQPLLKYVLAVPEAQLPDASRYFSIYCYGLVFQFVYNFVAAVLRALGDSKATLYFLLVSSVLNIILDYVFIVPCGFGVPGAAVATIISQAVSALVSILYMSRRYAYLKPQKGRTVFSKEKCILALKLGIPTTLQQAVVSCGHIAIQRLVNSFGVEFMSGFTAASRVESYLVIPALGFNTGVSTFSGQNIGAGNIKRTIEGLHKSVFMAAASSILLSMVAFFGATALVGFFGVEGDALSMGITYLHLVAPLFVIFGIYQCYVGLLQGSGDVMFTAFCTLSSLALRCILSYALVAFTDWGYRSICYAMPVGWCYVFLLCIWRYRRGKWKEKAVV